MEWNYEQWYVDISMLGYVRKILAQFKYEVPRKLRYIAYQPPLRKYGKKSREILPEDTTAEVNAERIKIVQQMIGGVLHYARAVDCTVLVVSSSITGK